MKYKLIFYSDWHCGSGLAAGADLDALVVKDANGLPYAPGKTIKGLVREASEYLLCGNKIKEFFGEEGGEQGQWNFSNAEIDKETENVIVSHNAQDFLYRKIAQTAIDEKTGSAKEHSLRKMEVVIPCELIGEVLNVEKKDEDILEKAFQYIKHLGQNRNRGLGRCEFSKIEEK